MNGLPQTPPPGKERPDGSRPMLAVLFLRAAVVLALAVAAFIAFGSGWPAELDAGRIAPAVAAAFVLMLGTVLIAGWRLAVLAGTSVSVAGGIAVNMVGQLVVLLVPSWASAGNALMTLNGAWHKVRDDAVLRFMALAALFYGISTFEGSFMAIRPVNSLSHYTDWTVGHVHAGALGWVAMITFGSLYALVPWIWKRPALYSKKLVELHFWLALSGTVVYIFAMWNSGIIQGLMWRTYSESGTLAYSFVDSLEAMHPYYIARTVGGTLFLLGAVCAAYNIFMTIRRPTPVPEDASADAPLPRPALQAGE